MILDHENLMSYKQAITVTAVSTNVLDLGPANWAGYAGGVEGIPLIMAVDTAFTDVGSNATLQVDIQSSPVENFGSGVITHRSRTFTFAQLAQTGQRPADFAIAPDTQRYVRASYTVANGPFTAGNLTLGVAAAVQTNR